MREALYFERLLDHSRPNMKRVYSCHHKRCWKTTFLVAVTRFRSDLGWSIYGLVLLNPHCPEFKSDYAAVWVMNYSPTCNPYLRDEPLLDSYYSIAINMINVLSRLEPAMTYSWWQTIHIPFVFLSNKFHLDSFFP